MMHFIMHVMNIGALQPGATSQGSQEVAKSLDEPVTRLIRLIFRRRTFQIFF
jgi:hypothetical protein